MLQKAAVLKALSQPLSSIFPTTIPSPHAAQRASCQTQLPVSSESELADGPIKSYCSFSSNMISLLHVICDH
jgi:hypothetical protein